MIADGHHRYEAALRFHEEDGSAETSHVLAALVSASDPGLTIFPTHRVSAGPAPDLDGSFDVIPVAGAAEALDTLDRLPRERAAFALLRPEGARSLPEADTAGLDTAVVDQFRLERVRFTPSADEAARGSRQAVRRERLSSSARRRSSRWRPLARAGERMPEKSTYFYPKLVGGLLFSPFDE